MPHPAPQAASTGSINRQLTRVSRRRLACVAAHPPPPTPVGAPHGCQAPWAAQHDNCKKSKHGYSAPDVYFCTAEGWEARRLGAGGGGPAPNARLPPFSAHLCAALLNVSSAAGAAAGARALVVQKHSARRRLAEGDGSLPQAQVASAPLAAGCRLAPWIPDVLQL